MDVQVAVEEQGGRNSISGVISATTVDRRWILATLPLCLKGVPSFPLLPGVCNHELQAVESYNVIYCGLVE